MLLSLGVVYGSWAASALQAQQWRGRVSTRVQYIEGRSLVLDSVPLAAATGSGVQRSVGDTLVTCSAGTGQCYFYRSGSRLKSAPLVTDFDLNLFGFGIEGLRAHGSLRVRSDVGDDEFWPRVEDPVDLLSAFVELNRSWFRVRLGRDYKVSGLGFYGFDGGSLILRYRPARIELEAYGGWGLERGLPQRVTSDAFDSLEEFKATNDNLLFGFRASVRPLPRSSLSAIYQREIETDRSGISSERLAFEGSYAPAANWVLEGHADYDLATGWWGKAGGNVGWSPLAEVYVEGRLFRYRPVFSLQTIWAVFSPVSYWGWGAAVALKPRSDLSLRFEGERRDYGDTEAESPFAVVTTDRTWRIGASGRWQPMVSWDVHGGYWRNWGLGAGVSSGNFGFSWYPHNQLSLGARFSAFDQIWEFRAADSFVWSLGADARFRTRGGTLWASLDRYRHDRKQDAAQTDWTQVRAALGFSYYLGTEPGRTP